MKKELIAKYKRDKNELREEIRGMYFFKMKNSNSIELYKLCKHTGGEFFCTYIDDISSYREAIKAIIAFIKINKIKNYSKEVISEISILSCI